MTVLESNRNVHFYLVLDYYFFILNSGFHHTVTHFERHSACFLCETRLQFYIRLIEVPQLPNQV